MYELNDSIFFLVDIQSIVMIVGIIIILIAVCGFSKARKVNDK